MSNLTDHLRVLSLGELFIVVMVVGLLTGICVPIHNHNLYAAKRAEAIASLNRIRIQVEIYNSENGGYPIVPGEAFVIGAPWNDIKPSELSGEHFSDSCFYYKCNDGEQWELIASNETPNLEDDLKLLWNGSYLGAD